MVERPAVNAVPTWRSASSSSIWSLLGSTLLLATFRACACAAGLGLLECIQAMLVHDAHDFVLLGVVELFEALFAARRALWLFMLALGHHGVQWGLEATMW